MNNSESKKRLLALQKSEFFSLEIPDTLRFDIQKLSELGTMTRKFPSPSWPTNDGVKLKKINWLNLCRQEIP